MRTFIAVLLVVAMMVTVCVAQEKEPLDDWYGMLEFQGGTTWDFKTACARLYGAGKVVGYKGWTGLLGTEFDIDDETEAAGPVTGLVGATYNVGNLRDWGVDISWARHIGLNVGFGITYDWTEDVWGWRAMASAVDLSFSDGGAKRQRER